MDNVDLLKMNADAGDPDACYRLAERYEREKDETKALYYYTLAADLGLRKADIKLGEHFCAGIGCVKDKSIAEWYFKRAADAGIAEAYTAIARLKEGTQESVDTEVVSLYETAVLMGDGSAALTLGIRLLSAAKTQDARNAAKQYFCAAAEKGIGEAYFYLGVIADADQSADAAAEHFLKGVEKRDPNAMRAYAERLYYGKGVREDKAAAYALLSDLDKDGQPGVAYLLALCCFGGYGRERNEHLAKLYLEKAATENNASALYFLAKSYEHGNNGCEENLEKALEFYRLSSKYGNGDATAMCGKLLLLGVAPDVDYGNALSAFQTAIEQKSKLGVYYLAFCYEKGFGVDIDFAKAKELYGKILTDNILDAKARYIAISERIDAGN